MKRCIKILSLLLIFATLLSCVAFASETATPYASQYLTSYYAYLWKSTDTIFRVWFEVYGTHTLSKIGSKTITIERSTNGSSWTTVETYYYTYNANMLASNKSYYTSSVLYTGTVGYYYRACVEIFGGRSSIDGDTRYFYTDPILL